MDRRFNESENEKREELSEKILSAIGDIRYGSVEIIHDSNGGIMMQRHMAPLENRRSLTNNRIKNQEKNL